MDAESEEKLCLNCKRRIAASNHLMHTIHCQRNIVLCPTCDEPVPKTQIESHNQIHVKTNCQRCRKSLEKCDLEGHEKYDCPKRLTACSFCELECAVDELKEHLEYCGSRTEECLKCGQFILLKEKSVHMQMACSPPSEATKGSASAIDNTHLQGFASFPARSISPHSGHGSNSPVQEVYSWQTLLQQLEYPTEHAGWTGDRCGGDLGLQNDYDQDVETVLLPCEFCGKSFPMDNIILHQSGCELSTRNLAHTYDDTQPQSISSNEPSTGIVTIPCEFCGDPITENDIGIHQLVCLKAKNVHEREPERSGVSGTGSMITTTEVPILATGQLVIGPSDGIESDVAMLPCEFCEQLFPDQNLAHHQAVCDRNPDQALASDQLYPINRGTDLVDSVLRYEGLTLDPNALPAVQAVDGTALRRSNVPTERATLAPLEASSIAYRIMTNGRLAQKREDSTSKCREAPPK